MFAMTLKTRAQTHVEFYLHIHVGDGNSGDRNFRETTLAGTCYLWMFCANTQQAARRERKFAHYRCTKDPPTFSVKVEPLWSEQWKIASCFSRVLSEKFFRRFCNFVNFDSNGELCQKFFGDSDKVIKHALERHLSQFFQSSAMTKFFLHFVD